MNHLTMQSQPESFQRWINYSIQLVESISDDHLSVLGQEFIDAIHACLATDCATSDSDDELFRCMHQRVMGAQLYAIARRLRDSRKTILVLNEG